MNRSSGIEPMNPQRAGRYTPLINQEDYHRNIYTTPVSKSVDPQVNYRPSKTKRSVEWDEENLQQTEGKFACQLFCSFLRRLDLMILSRSN